MLKVTLIFCALISNIAFAKFDLMVHSLQYLSADNLKGRRPGTEGNILATNYLKSKLQGLGIAGLDGKHLQEFTIFTKMIKTGDNSLSSKNSVASFEPISFSASGKLKNASVVFAGYGISIPQNDPKIKYDDYENIDVEGKIVVILTGDPAIGNPNSPFRDPSYLNYSSIIYKLKNAARLGAKAVVVIQDPLSIEDLNNEPQPYFNNQEGGGKRFSTIAGFSTNKWINKFLGATDTLKLQKKISQSQAPQSFEIKDAAWTISVQLKKETGRVSNVMGYIPGTDEKHRNEVIVLGAHFDHLGMGGQSSMEPSREPKIHNGADDNASGSSMVLKMAEYFSKNPPKRSLVLVFFNAEEEGLLGSAHFVSSWSAFSQNYGSLYGMLNFDMVGRFDKEVSLMGTGNAFEWADIIESVEGNRNIPLRSTKLAVGSSDHASFTQNKIPALFFTTGAHEDYHKSTDDFEKINIPAMEKLLSYSKSLINEVANPKNTLTFDPDSQNGDDPGRERGYGAHLGCVPQFGQSDDIVGVYCTKASPDSPAEKAGIVEGDVVVQIGDVEIKNIYDLVFALRFYRSGDKVNLKWKRGENFIVKEITLSTRKKAKGMSALKCHCPPTL